MKFGHELSGTMQEAIDRVVSAGEVDAPRADRFAAAVWGMIMMHMMEFLYPKPECGSAVAAEYGPGHARAMLSDLLEGFAPRARQKESKR